MSQTNLNKVWQPYVDTAIGAWQRGDKKRAEKIVSLLVQVLNQSHKYESVDENLVRGLYQMADFFCQGHEFWRAEWIYLHVLEIQEDILDGDSPQTLNTLMRLSRVVTACTPGFEGAKGQKSDSSFNDKYDNNMETSC